MEHKTNNRFVTTSSGAGPWFLTVCSRHTRSGTRTSTQDTQRAINLLPLWGVNKDQAKTGSPKPPGGLPRCWCSTWLRGVTGGCLLESPHLPLCTCGSGSPGRPHVQWGSSGRGRVARQGFLTPPPVQARAAKFTHPPKRGSSGTARTLEGRAGPSSPALDAECCGRGLGPGASGIYQPVWRYTHPHYSWILYLWICLLTNIFLELPNQRSCRFCGHSRTCTELWKIQVTWRACSQLRSNKATFCPLVSALVQ